MRKVVAIRDGRRRARPFAADPIALLAVAGGADVAAMTGFLIEAAVRRTPVLLDGVVSAAAALVAHAIAPNAAVWWRAAHRSAEPAQMIALRFLGLEPVLDLGIRAGEGAGALAVLPLLRAGVRACAETSTAEDATARPPGGRPLCRSAPKQRTPPPPPARTRVPAATTPLRHRPKQSRRVQPERPGPPVRTMVPAATTSLRRQLTQRRSRAGRTAPAGPEQGSRSGYVFAPPAEAKMQGAGRKDRPRRRAEQSPRDDYVSAPPAEAET